MPKRSAIPYVIYARSSSFNQEAIEEQKKKCTAYGYKHNLIKSGFFADFVSGYGDALHRRKNLVRLMHYVKKNYIKIVVVSDISRLSRSVRQGAFLLHWFALQGITVHDVEYLSQANREAPSLGWPYRKQMLKKLIAAEDKYHAHINMKKNAKKTGVHFSGTVPPWGYIYEGGKSGILIKNPNLQDQVAAVFRIALETAKTMAAKQGNEKSINYTGLYRKIAENDEFMAILKHLQDTGANKRLHNARSFKALIQNPFYAGYATAGRQDAVNRVHEPYISEKEHNMLNRGHEKCQIILPKPHAMSYIPLVKCKDCGGKLNKKGGQAWCPDCHKTMKEETLANAIADALGGWRIDRDTAFANHLIRRLKMGKLERLVKDIRDAFQPYQSSGAAVVDPEGYDYAAVDERRLIEGMEALILTLEGYNEIGYGEMAVEWLEARQAGRGREYIAEFGLELSYDFAAGRAIIDNCGPSVVASPLPLDATMAGKLVEERQNLRHEIKRLLEELPALVAVLEYDSGSVTGDFWTPFTDTLWS